MRKIKLRALGGSGGGATISGGGGIEGLSNDGDWSNSAMDASAGAGDEDTLRGMGGGGLGPGSSSDGGMGGGRGPHGFGVTHYGGMSGGPNGGIMVGDPGGHHGMGEVHQQHQGLGHGLGDQQQQHAGRWGPPEGMMGAGMGPIGAGGDLQQLQQMSGLGDATAAFPPEMSALTSVGQSDKVGLVLTYRGRCLC